jgi:hypothetical protein
MHKNIIVQHALYLIYENGYHFISLTSTFTLLSLYLIHSIVALLIYKLHSIIIQTLMYIQHS